MSKKQAKKLGGASASIRAETAKRPVYKSIVSTPFSIQWPKISNELGQTIIDHLIKILVPIGAYRKERKTQKKLKKPLDNIAMPDIYSRIHIGINQVTRYLQKHIDNNNNKNSQHVILYVCKRDIKPAQLCQHLLYMAAVANIKLIPMPPDSESKLSNALGMTKAACILVEAIENKEESLLFDAKQVPYINAPWLRTSEGELPKYRTNYVKTIETTAPIPNNAKRKAKEENKEEGPQQKKAKN